MAITREQTGEIIAGAQRHETDSGSAEVQISLLTKRIADLTEHVKVHAKDHSSRRGLLMLVGQRRRLLRYLKQTDYSRHAALTAKLGLRK